MKRMINDSLMKVVVDADEFDQSWGLVVETLGRKNAFRNGKCRVRSRKLENWIRKRFWKGIYASYYKKNQIE